MQGTIIEGCPDLVSAVYDAKRKKIRQYPQHVNRASEAGFPCERYLVYSRLRWEDKVLHGPEVEFIFEGGRAVEQMALNDLQEAGYTLIEQNRSYAWKEMELTGHIDVKIVMGDMLAGEKSIVYPIEIKGLNSFDFDKLNCIEDFLASKKTWIKKYPAQLCLYMLMSNVERGCFYLKRIPGFRPKQLWIALDFTYAEEILQKLERVNRHVRAQTYPEGVNDFEVCQYCAFSHICLPEIIGREIEIIDDAELLADIEEWFSLKSSIKKYDKLDDKIKSVLKGKAKGVIGEYMIVGKEVTKKPFTVEGGTYWKTNIVPFGKSKKAQEEE